MFVLVLSKSQAPSHHNSYEYGSPLSYGWMLGIDYAYQLREQETQYHRGQRLDEREVLFSNFS